MTLLLGSVLCYKNNINDKGIVVGFDTKGIPLIEAEDGNIHRYNASRWSKVNILEKYAFVVEYYDGSRTLSDQLYSTPESAELNVSREHPEGKLVEVVPVTWEGISSVRTD